MSLQLWIAIAAVFLSVALLVGIVASLMLSWTSGEQRRLKELLQPSATGILLESPQLTDQLSEGWKRMSKVVRKTQKEMNVLQRRLATAGYRGLPPAIVFSLAELVTPVVFAVATLIVLGYGARRGWIVALFFAVVGFLTPGVILERIIANRKREITNALPDALDLLVLCLEAGTSLDQAVVKTSEELDVSYPALGDELRVMTTEMRAGKARLEAFRSLADRTKIQEVRSLVSMLVQTDRFGTSIAQALRTHAAVSRNKRRQRAEEAAGKIGVKLVFPLVFCLFPAFFVVMLGPAILEFLKVFGQH
jgi:tight adherence protein C